MYQYHASILDTDLYKLTMQWAVLSQYPSLQVRYDFINRDNREFPDGFGKALKAIIEDFKGYRLLPDEKKFLREQCYYLPPAYPDFLEGYRYDPNEVTIVQKGHKLQVTIQGYWYRTILWEVPLMATISELYFQMTGFERDAKKCLDVNIQKFKAIDATDISFSEFGTRRRFSYENQLNMLEDAKKYTHGNLLGTSNVYLAYLYNLIPMGTHAHEFFSAHGAMFGYEMATKTALDAWIKVYQGDLGIALPDTFTTDVFLRSFNTFYAKLFDGVRHDSSDPIRFTDKIVEHYKSLRINPISKVILFSDNLNSIEGLQKINNHCRNKIGARCGIGTWLSNHVLNSNNERAKPLNMVIKLTGCLISGKWVPAIKLSDEPTKNTGNKSAIKLCKQTLGIPKENK